jgi:anti-sigma factor RsiW
MCEYSRKLIAWLDRELADDQMTDVQRHLGECFACRTRLAKYEQVSKALDSYCAAVVGANVHIRRPSWVPALSLVAAAAVAAAFAIVLLRPHKEQPVSVRPVVAAQPVVVPEATRAPGKVANRQRSRPRAPAQRVNWQPAEPVIQVAIPAESMFPPGAIPEGVSFTADVSFGPDGSAQQIRLRPRLIGFERRTTQP